MLLILINAKIDRVIDDYSIKNNNVQGGFFITIMKRVDGQIYQSELNFPADICYDHRNNPNYFDVRIRQFLLEVQNEVSSINKGKGPDGKG